MEKCDKCGCKKGHKMSCSTQKKTIVVPKFENEADKNNWGFGEKYLFDMLNNIVNGKEK